MRITTFSGVNLQEEAVFRFASFEEAHFGLAQFYAQAQFYKAKFSGEADFSSAWFQEKADISSLDKNRLFNGLAR